MKLELPWFLLLFVLISNESVHCKPADVPLVLSCSDDFCTHEDSYYVSKYKLVDCPACSIEFCNSELTVKGNYQYGPTSPTCCTGMHMGVIGPDGGEFEVQRQRHRVKGWFIEGATRNNITSVRFKISVEHYIVKKASPPTAAVTTTTTAAVVIASTTVSASTAATATSPATPTEEAATTTSTPPAVAEVVSTVAATAVITASTTASKEAKKVKSSAERRTLENSAVTGAADEEKLVVNVAEGKSFLSPPVKRVSTQKLPEFTSGINEFFGHGDNDTSSSGSAAIWMGIGIGAGAVVAILAALFAIRHTYKYCGCTLNNKLMRGRQRSNHSRIDGCVCYVNMESSKQGLLHDPETCDRPCAIKKQLIAGEDPPNISAGGRNSADFGAVGGGAYCNGDCTDCDAVCEESEKYSF